MAEMRFFRRIQAPRHHSAIFPLSELIFWLRTLYPYGVWRNQSPKHFEEVGTSPPTHLSRPNGGFEVFQKKVGPGFSFGHLWVIWSHLLAQNPLSILLLGKFSFEPLRRSWYITTEPPNYLYHFPEIMIGLLEALFFILFRLRSQIFKTLAQSPLSI